MRTVPDGARKMCMSTVALWRLIYKGQIPYVKIGKSVRLRDEDIDAFILANVRVHKPARKAK